MKLLMMAAVVKANEPSGEGAVDSNVDKDVDVIGGFDAVGHVDVDGPFW